MTTGETLARIYCQMEEAADHAVKNFDSFKAAWRPELEEFGLLAAENDQETVS